MISKICLITFYNLYESKRYFAEQLAKQLVRIGVQTALVDAQEGKLTYDNINTIRRFAPDLTLSFNTLLPDEEGLYLWDHLQIPHLMPLVDPAFYALDQMQSPYAYFSSVDRADCDWLQTNGIKNIFFWPHAVEANPTIKEVDRRQYEVLFLGSCTDFEGIEKQAAERLSKDEMEILQNAIKQMWKPPLCSLIEALVTSVNMSGLAPQKINFRALFYFLDNYVRGKDRYELIHAMRDVEVHIFGEPSWNNPKEEISWKRYFQDQANITLHPAVSYAESFQLLRQAKISLNSSPFFKHGSHERILNAFMGGAVPLTTHNGFVEEFFSPGEDLLTYKPGEWSQVNSQVKKLLNNEEKRLSMVEKGKAKVLKQHTWEIRASELIEQMAHGLNGGISQGNA